MIRNVRPIHGALSEHYISAFHKRVDRSGGPDACWPWTGTLRANGYGLLSTWDKASQKNIHYIASRIAWVLAHDQEVPEGMEVDHLCRVRHCCNPGHLEAVDPLVNIARSTCRGAINARKTHCIRGHAFTPENTWYVRYKDTGRVHRHCKACYYLRRPAKPRAKRERVPGVPMGERTHCKRGHEYNEANTRIDRRRDGRATRACRVCERERTRAYYAAKREAGR